MSNGRRGNVGNSYRKGFLRSPAWFARRARWFRDAAARGPIVCALCELAADPAELDLHHLDYRGVTRTSSGWVAAEPDEDLTPMHRPCHDALHRLIDRDRVLRRHRSRRDATRLAIIRLRPRMTATMGATDE